ncbi:hypothetical protein TNCT_7711 [Trichonephila clavata]|uniref:Uncharacterized protein n=1 Tax=Trichonephila clavata TaxID=2740835 RepID=A0A8X6LZU9_TRICU|nr:hypothetical protein TNCT_7711 [Trichonephila clavata]
MKPSAVRRGRGLEEKESHPRDILHPRELWIPLLTQKDAPHISRTNTGRSRVLGWKLNIDAKPELRVMTEALAVGLSGYITDQREPSNGIAFLLLASDLQPLS